VVIKTLGIIQKSSNIQKTIHVRVMWIEDTLEYPVAYFDGAAQGNGRCSGAGGIIKVVATTGYKWHLNCGEGSNTKAELMGLWATLFIANYLSITKLQTLGDSKVIINWINKKGSLRVSALEGWKQRISELKEKFISTSFYHIYREYNKIVDAQSKKGLLESEGYIVLHKWPSDVEGLPTIINIY
jgi:ribonuclease HI